MLRASLSTCLIIFLIGCSSHTPKYSSAEIASGSLAHIFYNPHGETSDHRAILFDIKNVKNEVVASSYGGSTIFDFYLEPGAYLFKTQCRIFDKFAFPATIAKLEPGKNYRVICENGKTEEQNGKTLETSVTKVVEIDAAVNPK